MLSCTDDNVEKYEIFPYPDIGGTFICGFCFTHQNYIHVIGGYNFRDLMERKYQPIKNHDDLLIGQHIALKYQNGKLKHKIEDLPYSRIIGGTCAFSEITETAYFFGGIHEQVGRESDLNSYYVSNILVSHQFGKKMTPIRTFLTPIGLSHPLGRVFHASAYDYQRNSIWIYGGGMINDQSGKLSMLNDLWEYQIQTQLWYCISHTIHSRQNYSKLGRSMVYFDNKLYVLGGNDKIPKKSLYILDLSDINRLKWKAVHIPERIKLKLMGCSLQVVHHPTLGPRILIIGGSFDDVYTIMATSLDLKVEQNIESLLPLTIFSFDPLRNQFEKISLPPYIPNVSFHGTALKDNHLFLIGGLNHSSMHRGFCRNIIVLDIFYYLDNAHKERFHLPFDHPLDENNIFEMIDFPELTAYLQNEKQKLMENENFLFFHQIYENHMKSPFPLEEFTMIKDQYCNNEILKERIKSKTANFHAIPINYANDFVFYLYTGMIHETKFISSKMLIDFIAFCIKIKFVRLVCLELLQNIRYLSPQDILTISSLSIDGVIPLVDDPDYLFLKYILFSLLRYAANEKLAIDFNPSKLFLISDYLIPLLDNNSESYPEIALPPFPQSTVFEDLILLYPKQQMECYDWILNIGNTNFEFNNKILKKTSHEVVIAVLQLSLKTLVTCEDIFSAFCLINSSKTLEKYALNKLLQDSLPQIQLLLTQNDTLKVQLVSFLPKIKHWILLKRCIEFIGYNCINYFIDKQGTKVPINLAFSDIKNFSYLQVDLSYSMIIILLFIMYTRIDLNNLKIESKKDKFAQTLFIVMSDYNFLIPKELQDQYARFTRKMYK